MSDSGPKRFERRKALQGLGALAVTPLLPGCSDPVGEQPEVRRFDDDLVRDRIDTVVVLMMENRSFDHYLGALSLLEGREDIDGLRAGMSNDMPDGSPVEVHPADGTCVEDPPHGWNSCHRQFADGACSGFVTEHAGRHGLDVAHRVMGYFDRETLSTFYALADEGVVFDRWFSSLMTSTWPNRYYSIAAQNGGVHGNDLPEKSDWPSIFDRVEAAGRSWTNYFGNIPFSILMPEFGLGHPGFLPMEEFFEDAARGTLPNLVWLDPIYGRNDDHPPTHPVAGQVLVSSIYQALANSPQWDRCLFLITYDEHGGFFDHVPPPEAPDAHADEGFGQLGFRVPSLAVGPWVRRGESYSEVCDHTSALAFIERLWGLDSMSERDAWANDLFDILDADRMVADEPRAPVTLPVIEASDEELYAEECRYQFSLREEDGQSDVGSDCVTGQPELEALVDAKLQGTRFDRRADTDALYEEQLARAVAQGVLRRR